VAYTFDADRGSPAPGFRLGLPAIQGPFYNNQAHIPAYLMIAPSGAHVELRQVNDSNVYEAVDSSYLQLLEGGNGSLLVRGADGTQMSYWSINSEYRCQEIKDRNGNFITIKYDPVNGKANLGRITSIIDTLGRTINFNYDVKFRLQTITQMRNGQPHVWASFGYYALPVEVDFSDNEGRLLGLPGNNMVSVLTQVGLDDGSRYAFDYTTWGQVYQIHHYAADGHELSHTSYNLPLDSSEAQTDCPRFTQRQDWAENWNGNAPVITTFESDPNGAWGQATVAGGTANQISYREYSTRDYADWTRGLVTRTEIYSPNSTTPKKTTVTDWTQDITNVAYPLNPRATAMTISDAEGNRNRTTIEYTAFGLPADVYELGPSGASAWNLLRRTHTDYDLSEAYVARRVIGLVKAEYLFGPEDNSQRLYRKVGYEYDAGEEFLQDQGSPVHYDGVSFGPGLVLGRGNLTKVRRWDVNHETSRAPLLSATTPPAPLFSLAILWATKRRLVTPTRSQATA
jgi:hypothetical protein